MSEVESRVSLFRFALEEFKDEIAKLLTTIGITDTGALELALKDTETSVDVGQNHMAVLSFFFDLRVSARSTTLTRGNTRQQQV